MKLKRISAIVLALAMTASLAAFAAEDETPDVVVDEGVIREVNHDQGDISLLAAPAGGGFGGGLLTIPVALPKQNYATTITINGEPLESYEHEKPVAGSSWETEVVTVNLTDLPSVPAGYIPMRAVAQADGGSAYWDKEGNRSWFDIGTYRIITNFNDMSVTIGLDGEPLEGVEVILLGGATFLPISVINSLEGYEVVDNGAEGYEIKTPNGAPIVKFAKALSETAGTGMGMSVSMEELELYWGESYGFTADMLSVGYVTLPMMTSPDTLFIGKIAEGQTQALETVLEAYRAAQESTFSWYLSHNLPKVEDARFVTEGDWFLFFIGENADAVVEQFKTEIHTLDEAQ